ncbi:MAG: BMP family ABC transporter substrate-binding protein [Angelakisella sp.]
MKRVLAILLAMTMALSLAACGGAPAAGKGDSFELALITDIGTIDDKSFNQGSWEGLEKYALEKKITHKYYKPTEKSTDAYLSAIELAVKGGAKVIVTPGFLFEEPIFIAQDQYPNVKFVIIDTDGGPHDADYKNFKTGENTVGIAFAEEQAGFLAGYAAVKDGYTKFGFLGGMAVPAVVRFGYGYVQGVEYAAKELGLKDVLMNYHYTGGFDATPEAQTLCASWYNDGVEVIFGCGGAVGNSAMAAATQANGKVIGVDVDQSGESPTVITSSTKGLGESVYQVLDQYYSGKFPGGQHLILNAANNGVGLPMATSKFQKFSKADYDAIYDKLVKDTDGIASGIVKVFTDDAAKDFAGMSLVATKVNVVK